MSACLLCGGRLRGVATVRQLDDHDRAAVTAPSLSCHCVVCGRYALTPEARPLVERADARTRARLGAFVCGARSALGERPVTIDTSIVAAAREAVA